MGAWRVEQHYGFGAACLPIPVEPLLRPRNALSMGEGIAGVRSELHGRSLRLSLGLLPALLLGLTVCLSFVTTVLRERMDESDLEVVVLARARPEPTARPEPEVVPVPEPRIAPAPPPRALRKPPPAPAPVQVARIEPPPPPAATKRLPPRPAPPSARPKVAIDALVRAPVAPPPAAPRPPPVVAPVRVALAMPAVTSATRRPEPPPAAPAPGWEPARFAAVRPPAEGTARPRLDLAPALAAVPAAPDPAPRRGRLAPAPLAQPRGAALAAPPLPLPLPAAPVSAPASAAAAAPRSAHAAHTAPAGGEHASMQLGLQGVPLGSLASCVSEREEDRLKQQLVAAVRTQKHCTSSAGSYRFVETKNLNSFLLWIERAPARSPADRCAELANALNCLAAPAGRESN